MSSWHMVMITLMADRSHIVAAVRAVRTMRLNVDTRHTADIIRERHTNVLMRSVELWWWGIGLVG